MNRGELPQGIDVELAVDCLAGRLFYRRQAIGVAPDKEYVARVVDQVLAGLRAPVGVREGR